MKSDKTGRAALRGYMLEVVVRRLLEENDFEVIKKETKGKVEFRGDNIEIKGRGTWHQIDSPCIYNKSIPFTYDLRLLAEVKFYKDEVQKNRIREYIGVIKDISENYFLDDNNTIDNQKRYTDIGVFFSASGFQIEAEKLAFAHGIKTVSYKNNQTMSIIRDLILNLEENYLYSKKCVGKGNLKSFMKDFYQLLENTSDETWMKFERYYNPLEGARDKVYELSQNIRRINSSFFGVTETNYFIHFLSNDSFPAYLFHNSDEAECQIFFDQLGQFYLTINNSEGERFYFTAPPDLLSDFAFANFRNIAQEKGRHFKNIKISITLENIQRNLILKIDEEWLREVLDNTR
ncbi:hypothetical protein MettiDRAFT_2616 [Methanolobus tindarius DSM 2278]|uniref:Restriction endonuclease type IV Mrr domain-containing protein n=1 Tax=Methanolobus tindarius DSM 2278 TaxID=1090322 RepID=W9DZL1_METTI|nr:hypothetical protein [Methanolobus tindarius]ETA69122.1 hypothetical protein MettiDRAFT_2616 [Methanolobus tindarius DSM 2278]